MPADALSQHADAYYLSLVDSGAQPQPGAAAAISGDGLGFVDELILRDGQLLVRGWAVDSSGALPDRLGIRIKGKPAVVNTLDKQSRSDVQRHLSLPHALVGYQFAVVARIVAGIAELPTRIAVKFSSGASLRLARPLAS